MSDGGLRTVRRIDLTLTVEGEEDAKAVMASLIDMFVADDRIESFDGDIEEWVE